MKTLQTSAIITGIRSKSDRSLGISISTPEYTPEEASEMLRLQGMNVTLTIEPMDENATETMVIDREAGGKKPSERLYNVLFVLWKEKFQDKWPTFNMFYEAKMDQIIEQIKEKLS